MNSLGNKTRTVILNHESHKLHLEFTASNDIKKGQPVKLHTDGTVRAYVLADAGTTPILGFSLHDAANTETCTVMCKGSLVLMGVAEAAIASTGMCKFSSFYSGSNGESYNRVTTASTTISNYGGWVLDTAAAQNDEVRILCN